jgi:hypothetical protein
MAPRLYWAQSMFCCAASRYHFAASACLAGRRPFLIHASEIDLGVGITLVRGFPIQSQCLRIVLRHAAAVGIHAGQNSPGVAVAFVGQQAKQPQRGRVVRFDIRRHGFLEHAADVGVAKLNAVVVGVHSRASFSASANCAGRHRPRDRVSASSAVCMAQRCRQVQPLVRADIVLAAHQGRWHT